LLYRSMKNTLTTSLVILLVFAIPALFSSPLKNNTIADLFSKINPIDNIFSSLDNVLVDYQTSVLQNWHYILPLVAFCVVGFALLIFAIRRFNREGVIKSD
jgi:ABC-type polysaccharide/polyol phosphate export permease